MQTYAQLLPHCSLKAAALKCVVMKGADAVDMLENWRRRVFERFYDLQTFLLLLLLCDKK